jgi:LytR cell envelope-related transcriptional attenuator
MEIIEQIGAYAGLAAVLGLAVLSALYFSQARDVRRLREWAGRAPERVAEGADAAQLERGVVAQPQPKVVQDAGRPGAPPVPAGAPAAAAATGAAPASAAAKPGQPGAPAKPGAPAAQPGTPAKPGAPKPATPAATPAAAQAGQQAKPGAPAPVPAAAAAATAAGAAGAATQAPDKPDGGQPAAPSKPGEAAPAAAPAKPGAPAPAKPGPPAPAAAPSGAPPKPGPPKPPPGPKTAPAGGIPGRPTIPRAPGRGAPSPAQTAIIPPKREAPWYRRLLASPRYLVLAIAGVLILGSGVAFGVVQLTSDDEGGGSGGGAGDQAQNGGAPAGGGGGNGGGNGGNQKPAAPVDPASVTVAVLNGTTINGLAAQYADLVAAAGYNVGNIANSADQGARNESVVLFANGHEREAEAVSKELDIAQREQIDPETQALAGDATVVVITGSDLTP